MQVEFREFDPFNVWIWVRLSATPSDRERQYLEEIFESWFFLGKLGGFNAENLQVQEVGLEVSYMEYDNAMADQSMVALMHNMSEVEYEDNWARCWFDLGTSDALAIDVLINALKQLNQDFMVIEQLYIGGENADWQVPGRSNPEFVDDEWK
jgi:Protein of unknown function (DUF3531)